MELLSVTELVKYDVKPIDLKSFLDFSADEVSEEEKKRIAEERERITAAAAARMQQLEAFTAGLLGHPPPIPSDLEMSNTLATINNERNDSDSEKVEFAVNLY